MIIAAGHGIGMVNWSMVEPLITNNAAPLGHGANAAYSYEVATAYTFFHWGPYYWVLCTSSRAFPSSISWACVR